MTIRLQSSLFALTALIGGWVLWPQASAALTLIPPSLEFTAQPGQAIETKVKLFNEEQNPVSVFTSTANFGAKGEAGDPDFDFQDTPTDLASWIDVGVGPFTLQPGDRLEIPVTIKVPVEAEPGGHYTSLFFGTDPSILPEGGGQVNVRSLIGTLLILRVEGEIREAGTIASFGVADDQGMFNRLPASFALRINNQGNVHFRPQGTVVIRNLFGGETARLTINEANGAVLPNSVRRFTSAWTKNGQADKPGNFFQEIGAEWRNFALGPYTATATVTYGESGRTLTSSAKVTIIPWRILILFGLGVVGLILVLTVGLKRYNASVIKHAQRPPSA